MVDAVRAAMKSVRVPTRTDRVFKDECMFSFDTPETPSGLFTSLTTWQSFGEDHVRDDFQKHGHPLYLKQVWKRVQVDQPESDAAPGAPEAPSKMAIGVEGGFDTDQPKFTHRKQNFLVVLPDFTSIPLPCDDLPTVVSMAVDAVLAHDGFVRQAQVTSAWEEDDVKESKYAKDLPQLDNGKRISPDPKTWRCEESGMTENLWLNLSTGHIGSGRQNWDGSGGTGAALKHYTDTGKKYPLAVKLGTITPAGADVFSYADDENDMVLNPNLSKHLAHWGINMQQQEKTERTMTELTIELNSSYNFSKITESGSDLEPLHGPGFVGLQNLGNSCYMASVMQILFTIPEICARYHENSSSIFHSAPADPSDDIMTMMAKLGTGLLSTRYTKPLPLFKQNPSNEDDLTPVEPTSQDYGSVRPFMFKHVVGKGHAEYCGSRQQDASEFFQYFLEKITRAERAGKTRLSAGASSPAEPAPTSALFDFDFEDRVVDSQTKKVKYLTRSDTVLSLGIDLNDAVNLKQFNDYEEQRKKRTKYDNGSDEAPVTPEIPLASCLERFAVPEVIDHFKSPDTGAEGTAMKTTRFKSFPEYLAVHMRRYYLAEDWTPKKLDASVPMPEELDLTHLRGTGLKDNETLMSDDPAPADSSAAVVPNTDIVKQLMGMGFSENGSKRAAIAMNNSSAEACMEWVFQHMDDPDFNEPIPESAPAGPAASGASHNAEQVGTLAAMGFSEEHAKAALTATDGSLERAADWLFSRADDLDAAVREVNSKCASTSGNASGETGAPKLDGPGKYEMVGFASHLGSNTSCGHYVAHIKKDGRFVLFNDEKVAVSKKAPTDLGFLYFYRRKKE